MKLSLRAIGSSSRSITLRQSDPRRLGRITRHRRIATDDLWLDRNVSSDRLRTLIRGLTNCRPQGHTETK